MATNLRLSPRAQDALRTAAARAGRSQQDLLREAVDTYLGLDEEMGDRDAAITSGLVRAPSAFRDTRPTLRAPAGQSSLDLLDRDDR